MTDSEVPLIKKEKTMDKKKYCANGDEGIEFVADTESEVREWIASQKDEGVDEPFDYYNIEQFTQAELDAMPEV